MNDELYDRYVADLRLKSYQKRSVQSYMRSVRQLQNFTNKALEDITEEDVREYWLYCKEDLGWGAATLRISYSGIKLFYSLTFKRDWEVLRSVKFERDQTLPVVLNIDEVRAILGAIPNLQNRAFYTVMYACGLRLGEAINLQVADVDGKRKFIHVRHGKGAKDRLVPVADSALDVLRDFYKTHRNPTWLFPALGKGGTGGPTAEQPVSETTVHGALHRAVVKAGIRKTVVPHTLRHYAEYRIMPSSVLAAA